MSRVRLGAVGYLNARPLVWGLEQHPRFDLRYDIPSECARLLHAGDTGAGLIPSIEYLRGGPYRIVPGLAIASLGAVASVAIYTKKPMADVRVLALDTSSRTSVALTRVLCARQFGIRPELLNHGPDLPAMLARADAGLIIGDNALFLDHAAIGVEKIDLGEVWLSMTGLPFVYAFWAGRRDALEAGDVDALVQARNAGVAAPEDVARAYFPDSPERQAVGARYLRDNIKYHLGVPERAALDLFYRYAAEAGVVDSAQPLRFY